MLETLRHLELVHVFLYGMALVTTVCVIVARVRKIPKESKFREYAEAGFFAIWVALAVRTTVAEAQSIPSESMVPTFLVGDNLLVTKYNWGYHLPGTKGRVFDFGKPERGQVVTFLPPLPPAERKNFVKRCVGIPGDTIEVKNKHVFIDGKMTDYPEAIGEVSNAPVRVVRDALTDQYNLGTGWYGPVVEDGRHYWVNYRDGQVRIYGRILDFAVDPKPGEPAQARTFNHPWFGPVTLGPGEYFMMGDNRDNSMDSRTFGTVVYEDLRGTPVLRYFPFSRAGTIQ